MRTLSFIFFFAVAMVALMSATCTPRTLNPGRPFDFDTTTTGGGGGPTEGFLRVTVKKFSEAGQPAGGAKVKLFADKAKANTGSPHLVEQTCDAQGVTVFEWTPGEYYIVSEYTEGTTNYISDTAKIQDFQPTPSGPKGPQLVDIVEGQTKNVVDPVDLRK